jgi:hypothetical protein
MTERDARRRGLGSLVSNVVERRPGGLRRTHNPSVGGSIPPGPTMRRVLLVVGATLTLGACSGDGGNGADEREAAIYSVVIETAASEAGSAAMPFDGPVYVLASRGHDIGIETQVDVVDRLDDMTIRFVDDRDEAIKESTDDAPVLGDGLLVTLGRIRGRGDQRTVPVARYLRLDDDQRYDVTLERRDHRWVVTEPPSLVR